MSKNIPKFPLYIPSKGRSEYMITSKVLTSIGIEHYIVVEPQEEKVYKRAIETLNLKTKILILDLDYKNKYQLCDNLGLTKSTGAGPARNFAWDHSIKSGYSHHWVMDDNIMSFRRLNYNEKVKVSNGAIFKAMEDFTLRYKNVAMSGPNYFMFASARTKMKPFILNTRIYSCNFIKNDISFRWRGRYNEDTILSLDLLKAGYCTIQFNAFLQEKMPTQTIKGGNTTELYLSKDGTTKRDNEKYAYGGTFPKSKMLVDVHPDVAKMVIRYSRHHHHVDYSIFKKNKLIKRDDISIENGVNNYGMNLKKIK